MGVGKTTGRPVTTQKTKGILFKHSCPEFRQVERRKAPVVVNGLTIFVWFVYVASNDISFDL